MKAMDLEANKLKLEWAARALRHAAYAVGEAIDHLKESDVTELADGKLLDRLGDTASFITESQDTVNSYRNVVIERIEHPDPFEGINR